MCVDVLIFLSVVVAATVPKLSEYGTASPIILLLFTLFEY